MWRSDANLWALGLPLTIGVMNIELKVLRLIGEQAPLCDEPYCVICSILKSMFQQTRVSGFVSRYLGDIGTQSQNLSSKRLACVCSEDPLRSSPFSSYFIPEMF